MEWPPEVGERGWRLVSAEGRHAEAPETFSIPTREEREALRPGQGAKLLFMVADEDAKSLVAQVERMWVVVTEVTGSGYVGVLASSPASSHSVGKRGSAVTFAAEHICDIDDGPSPDELEDLLRDAAQLGKGS